MSASEPPDLARLRAALAASRGRDAADADAERVFDALHGDMSPEQRQAVIDELLTTADGTEVWRLAMELAPSGVEKRSTIAPRSQVWRWMPLAAALVIVVGGAWFVYSPWLSEGPPAYRSLEGPTIESAIPEGTRLSRANVVLRWTPIEGARYRVRVLTEGLEPLDEAADLTNAEYRVRPESLDRLPSGAPLLWQVEARIPGTAAIVSPTFRVQLE